jgi:hypothetical protein
VLSVSRYSYTGGNKGWKRRRRLLLAAAAAPVVLRVGLAVRPAARLRFAPALRPRGRRTRRSCAAAAPHRSTFGFPVPTSGGPARRRAPVLEPASPRRGTVLECLTAARGQAPVVLIARPLRRPIFEAAAARRSSRIKASARRRSILETTPTGRSIISKAAAASITEAAAASITETAARRRPVVGPRAAAAPVRRPVGGGAPLAFGGLRSLSLGRALRAQALGLGAVPGDLGSSALLVLATCVQITR